MTAARILSIARSYIGVVETQTNNVVFNTAYYGKEVNGSAYPWCAVFIWYVFREAGASDLYFDGEKTAYCPTLMAWFKRKKRFYASPKVGDIVFYHFGGGKTATHVGIVSEVTKTGIKAIEGNTSTVNQNNGGMVMERERSLSNCLGFGRPAYKEDKAVQNQYASTATYKVGDYTLRDIKYGDKGDAVVFLQQCLQAAGYDIGSADGIAGVKTMAGVAQFQLEQKTTTCGHGTWNLLFDKLDFKR